MKKVLVVDDSVMWREFIKEIVEERGHMVEIAQDGLEGYNKAFEFVPDIVFVDVVMPKLNGYHLCRLLKNTKTFKRAGIVIMTTLEESLTRFWAYKSGADGFIRKSSIDEVVPQIEKFLENDNFKAEWSMASEPKQPLMELSSLLDNLLLKETIKGEIYSLFNHITDEDHVLWRLSDLMFDVLSIDSLAILVMGTQSGTIFFKSNVGTFNTESVKEKLLSVFSKPSFPPHWSFKGEGISSDGTLQPDEFLVKIVEHESEEIGSIGVHPERLTQDEMEILDGIIENVGGLFKMMTLYSRAMIMANYDELTKLYNFRTLMEKLTEYFSLSKRQNYTFSIAMMDIDHFKSVNDTFGHLIGNEVLKSLASLMKESFRSTDIVGRYGGEEFAVGLFDTGVDEAFKALERFRKVVEDHDWSSIHEGLRVTISVGLASTEIRDYRTVVEMIEDADRALYESKRSGRNRVTVWRG